MDKTIGDKNKYVYRDNSVIIGNCPFCRGVLLKNFKIGLPAKDVSFLIRCPHCQKNATIEVKDNNVFIKKSEDNKDGENS